MLAKGNSDIDASDLPECEEVDSPVPRTKLYTTLKRSKVYFYSLSVLAFLSFVLDSLRTVILPKAADRSVDVLILAMLVLFIIDMGVQAKASASYALSLPFWLDLWATVGLLSEVAFVYEHFFSECRTWYFYRLRLTVKSARLSSSAIRIIRHTARNATQEMRVRRSESSYTPSSHGSRIMKGASLVDLPMAKISYELGPAVISQELHRESTALTRNKVVRGGTFNRLCEQAALSTKLKHIPTVENSKITYESKISKIVTRSIVSSMAVITIVTICFSWLFTLLTVPEGNDKEYGLKLLSEAQNLGQYQGMVWEFINLHTREMLTEGLVRLEEGGDTVLWETELEDYRVSEVCSVSYLHYTATFSIQPKLRCFAVFELCETLILILLFLYASLSISSYFRNMIIFPLERMTETIRLIWKNPLNFMKSRPASRSQIRRTECCCCKVKRDYAEDEIRLLENAFSKIGVMLGMVYGSAGSEMITNSIGLEGNFTPLIPGKEILAVFCFVKIGNFDSVLSVLGPGALKYINYISGFVHNMAERFLGSVNRNLGDSFLLLWKVPEDDKIVVGDRLVVNPYSAVVKLTAGLAVLFAVKTIAKVGSCPTLLQYRNKIGGSAKTNGLTFGFHIGWAYEGPIGSAFKIDASYLSPNVNMAARIETAAQQYEVSILLSSDMYTRLGDEVRTYLRHIDTVKLKGIFEPVMLYSFDINEVQLQLSYFRISKRKTYVQRRKLKLALEQNLLTVADLFAKSDTLSALRGLYNAGFMQTYENGLKLYIAGRWNEACGFFERCLYMIPDGPSRTLLSYMSDLNLRPPLDWSGVRELTAK
jgi:class 3 adenylate cyclase